MSACAELGLEGRLKAFPVNPDEWLELNDETDEPTFFSDKADTGIAELGAHLNELKGTAALEAYFCCSAAALSHDHTQVAQALTLQSFCSWQCRVQHGYGLTSLCLYRTRCTDCTCSCSDAPQKTQHDLPGGDLV